MQGLLTVFSSFGWSSKLYACQLKFRWFWTCWWWRAFLYKAELKMIEHYSVLLWFVLGFAVIICYNLHFVVIGCYCLCSLLLQSWAFVLLNGSIMIQFVYFGAMLPVGFYVILKDLLLVFQSWLNVRSYKIILSLLLAYDLLYHQLNDRGYKFLFKFLLYPYPCFWSKVCWHHNWVNYGLTLDPRVGPR